MSQADKVFAGSIPELYDRYLVPLIFEHYAADLAGRTAALAPGSSIETMPSAINRLLAASRNRSRRTRPTESGCPLSDD